MLNLLVALITLIVSLIVIIVFQQMREHPAEKMARIREEEDRIK